jgi:hypothetical protein
MNLREIALTGALFLGAAAGVITTTNYVSYKDTIEGIERKQEESPVKNYVGETGHYLLYGIGEEIAQASEKK